VPKIDRFTEHHGTAAGYYRDARLLAELDRRFGNAAFTEGAMHPHHADTSLPALLNDLQRNVRMRGDNNALDPARNRGNIWIAGVALYLGRVWIDGKDLKPFSPELLVDGVGSLCPSPGYTCDCNTLQSQELIDCRSQITHSLTSLRHLTYLSSAAMGRGKEQAIIATSRDPVFMPALPSRPTTLGSPATPETAKDLTPDPTRIQPGH
jgi:hypothetical protein